MQIDISKIPDNPGCYLFLDEAGKIIYVGKAKNLKKRVSSYFSKKDHDEKTLALLRQTQNVDFIVTNNEVEALILENNLIKKNTPKYNIDLKDSKRYAYLEITNEEFPKLEIERKTKSDGKLYGPFTSGQKRDYVRDLLIKTFKIRTCNKMPKKPCLRYYIGLCDAPCVNKISKERYNDNVKQAEMILRGKVDKLVDNLGKIMKNASNTQDYEVALETRDKINAVKWLREKQTMERQKTYDEDVINYIEEKGRVYLMVFNVHEGILENKKDFEFDGGEDFFEEFLVQFYSETEIPSEIIVPHKIDESIIDYLEKLRGKKVRINVPEKGEKKDLLDLVKKNIEIQFFSNVDKLTDVKNKLNLSDLPVVIECFDISHLGGTNNVASMVQFRNAVADKSNYRRFKLRTVEGIDDFAAMKEVVGRRYKKLLANKENMPNLIMIDGGAGQLSSAMEILSELNLKIPIIALAKREEEIYIPGRKTPLKLSKKSKTLLLLIQIRDEAHRFAIKYQRLLRKKDFEK